MLASQPRSRGYAINSYYLGDAFLALGRNDEALANLELAERIMRDLGALPEVSCLLAIQAQAGTCGDQYAPCPDSTTPSLVDLQVDWVEAYAYTGH